MTWTLIDSATERDAVLELYGKDGRFMIRANGLELMNGFCHELEAALGRFRRGARANKGGALPGRLDWGSDTPRPLCLKRSTMRGRSRSWNSPPP